MPLVPVEHDPFKPVAAAGTLTPVEHDPFAPVAQPAPTNPTPAVPPVGPAPVASPQSRAPAVTMDQARALSESAYEATKPKPNPNVIHGVDVWAEAQKWEQRAGEKNPFAVGAVPHQNIGQETISSTVFTEGMNDSQIMRELDPGGRQPSYPNLTLADAFVQWYNDARDKKQVAEILAKFNPADRAQLELWAHPAYAKARQLEAEAHERHQVSSDRPGPYLRAAAAFVNAGANAVGALRDFGGMGKGGVVGGGPTPGDKLAEGIMGALGTNALPPPVTSGERIAEMTGSTAATLPGLITGMGAIQKVAAARPLQPAGTGFAALGQRVPLAEKSASMAQAFARAGRSMAVSGTAFTVPSLATGEGASEDSFVLGAVLGAIGGMPMRQGFKFLAEAGIFTLLPIKQGGTLEDAAFNLVTLLALKAPGVPGSIANRLKQHNATRGKAELTKIIKEIGVVPTAPVRPLAGGEVVGTSGAMESKTVIPRLETVLGKAQVERVTSEAQPTVAENAPVGQEPPVSAKTVTEAPKPLPEAPKQDFPAQENTPVQEKPAFPAEPAKQAEQPGAFPVPEQRTGAKTGAGTAQQAPPLGISEQPPIAQAGAERPAAQTPPPAISETGGEGKQVTPAPEVSPGGESGGKGEDKYWKPLPSNTPNETIRDRLGDRRSARVGTLHDGDRQLSLILRPDTSSPGEYSVVVGDGKNTQSFRMMYAGGKSLADMMGHFQEYLNTDNPGRFRVELSARPEAKPDAPTKTADQGDAAELRRIQRQRFKTAADDIKIRILKAQISADPSKWNVGDGVGYYAGVANSKRLGSQINRGFRIVEVDADNKMVKVRQVADTGLTTSGGNTDRIADEWIHVAFLVRDAKYSGKPAQQPSPAPLSPETGAKGQGVGRKEPWEMTRAEATDATRYDGLLYSIATVDGKPHKPEIAGDYRVERVGNIYFAVGVDGVVRDIDTGAVLAKGASLDTAKEIIATVGERGYRKRQAEYRAKYGEVPLRPGSHQEAVKNALAAGKPVPRAVLEEYRGQEWADKALQPVKAAGEAVKPDPNLIVIKEKQAKPKPRTLGDIFTGKKGKGAPEYLVQAAPNGKFFVWERKPGGKLTQPYGVYPNDFATQAEADAAIVKAKARDAERMGKPPTEKAGGGEGNIETGFRVQPPEALSDETGAVSIGSLASGIARGIEKVGGAIKSAGRWIGGEQANVLNKNRYGRYLGQGLNDISERVATLKGKVEGELVAGFKGLTRQDQNWMMRVDSNGITNYQKMLDYDALQPPNERIARMVDAERKMLSATADEAERVGVPRIGRGGKVEPFQRAKSGRYIRILAPDALDAIERGSGPTYDALVDAVMRLNPDLKNPLVVGDTLRAQLGVLPVRKTGSLENVRFIEHMPTFVKVGNTWVEVQESHPLRHAMRALDYMARKTYFVEKFGSELNSDFLDRLRRKYVQSGGKATEFDNVVKVWFGRPLFTALDARNPLKRAWRGASNLLSGAHLSLSWVLNIPQPFMLLPRYTGWANTLKGLWNVTKGYPSSRDRAVAIGAAHQATTDLYLRRGYLIEDVTGAIKKLAIKPQEWTSDWNDTWTAEAFRAYADKARKHGVKPGEARVLRELRLSPEEIRLTLAGQMPETAYNKIIQNGPKITQFMLEDAHRRSAMQNIPIFNEIFSYNNYLIGTGKAVARQISDLGSAIAHPGEGRGLSTSKRAFLFVTAAAGVGAAQLMLRRAVRGQPPQREDETQADFWKKAMFEIGVLGPAQRMLDATGRESNNWQKVATSLMPKINAIGDAIFIVAGKGQHGKLPAGDRATVLARRNVPAVSAFMTWAERVAYPSVVPYEKLRQSANQFERDVLKRQSQPPGDYQLNPDYYAIKTALRRLDADEAINLTKAYYAQAEAKGVKRDRARTNLMASLNHARPINLNENDKKAFLASLDAKERQAAETMDWAYQSLIDELTEKSTAAAAATLQRRLLSGQ